MTFKVCTWVIYFVSHRTKKSDTCEPPSGLYRTKSSNRLKRPICVDAAELDGELELYTFKSSGVYWNSAAIMLDNILVVNIVCLFIYL